MKKRVVIFALLIALALLCGSFAWKRSRESSLAAAKGVPLFVGPSVGTSRAFFGTFTQRIRAHGRIGEPSGSNLKLAFFVPSVVSHISVRVGETVRAGEDLATSADAEVAASASFAARARLEAARAHLSAIERGKGTAVSENIAARAALVQSEARRSFDERTLAREEALYQGGVAARKDVDAAEQQLVFDRADEQANRAKTQSATEGVGQAAMQARADYATAASEAAAAARTGNQTTLRSPADGVVVAIFKRVGESTDPATPVLEIGSSARKTATLTIPGSLAQRVRAGNSIDFTARDRHARGRVLSVIPNVDPLTQTATVIAEGAPSGMLNGEAVDALIAVGRLRGVLVPIGALAQDPQTGKTLAFVRAHRADGSFGFSARTVVVGEEDDQDALITSGLRAGEIIATQGTFDLLAPLGGG